MKEESRKEEWRYPLALLNPPPHRRVLVHLPGDSSRSVNRVCGPPQTVDVEGGRRGGWKPVEFLQLVAVRGEYGALSGGGERRRGERRFAGLQEAAVNRLQWSAAVSVCRSRALELASLCGESSALVEQSLLAFVEFVKRALEAARAAVHVFALRPHLCGPHRQRIQSEYILILHPTSYILHLFTSHLPH